jgi:chaperone modulatory protein CbpM
MRAKKLIEVENFCVWHNIEFSFLHSLHEQGLIEITTREDKSFIPEYDLKRAEILVRLYNDLHINLEGVEVITYLLEQLKTQREEITQLQNRLGFYET